MDGPSQATFAGPEEPLAPPLSGTSPAESEDEVARLLSAFRVLLRHVVLDPSGQPLPRTAAVPASLAGSRTATAGGAAVLSATVGGGVDVGLLTRPMAEIARDPVLLTELYAGLDMLKALAAPADLESIRLTAAFLRQGGVEPIPPEIVRQGRRLRHWAIGAACFGLLLFALTVMLLIHVDWGRRSIQQLESVDAERKNVLLQLAQARPGPDGGAATCARPPADRVAVQAGDQGGDQETDQGTSRPGEPAPCARLHELAASRALIQRSLQQWNAISERLGVVSPFSWHAASASPAASPAAAGAPNADGVALRTSAIISAMTGFILPMLLGLLGAFAYVYRNLDRQVSTATLQPSDAWRGALRMTLGTILGGLLGVLWTNGQPVQLEGVTLSLSALAFFVGFAVEIVFRTVEALIGSVAAKLR